MMPAFIYDFNTFLYGVFVTKAWCFGRKCQFKVKGTENAGRRWSPEEDSSIISKLFFIYVNSLMRLGASKHLEQDDVWDIAKANETKTVSTIYNTHMLRTADHSKHPYVRNTPRSLPPVTCFSALSRLWLERRRFSAP